MWLAATLLSAISGYFIIMRDRWSAVFFDSLFAAVQYFMPQAAQKHGEYFKFKEEQERKIDGPRGSALPVCFAALFPTLK